MSYERAQQNRQAVLDYLHAHPMKSANQLSIETGIPRTAIQTCVKFMTARDEIRKIGKGKETCYRALVYTTVSAKEVMEEVMEARRKKAKENAPKRTETPPWLTRSCDIRDPNRDKPIQGQGGQGAIRRPWGIQSSMA